ncbi:hypothetical protein [Hamadaea tsunoensis]|uniref:hypothetical protein n=1 Tax=Hamadaea tsunoensis TaxID=53368 RepID=UPI0003F739E2|nr:hypothetical protein [Hamadaea tsunoensis]
MTAGVLAPPHLSTDAFWAPVRNALTAMNAADEIMFGPAVGEWLPASALAGPAGVKSMLDTAARRWQGTPHAAAALAWKSYSYWAALPVVLSWAATRRVPLLTADSTFVRFHHEAPFLQVRTTDVPVAVLPDDPLAHQGALVAPSEEALLGMLRETLLDRHFDGIVDALRDEVRIGRRTLLGSVASGVSYGLIRATDALPGSTHQSLLTLLDALDLTDLVDICETGNGLDVQRRTCCLAFTLEQPKVCGGCCIR